MKNKKGDIIKTCVADECEGYHEGCCIMGELYKGFNPWTCTAKSNADLIPACVRCDVNPATGKFPFDDMCEECAKEAEREFDEE